MCKKTILTVVALAMLALAIGQVQAVTVTVPIDNPGFEDSVLADGAYDYSMDDQGWGYFARRSLGDSCPVGVGWRLGDPNRQPGLRGSGVG